MTNSSLIVTVCLSVTGRTVNSKICKLFLYCSIKKCSFQPFVCFDFFPWPSHHTESSGFFFSVCVCVCACVRACVFVCVCVLDNALVQTMYVRFKTKSTCAAAFVFSSTSRSPSWNQGRMRPLVRMRVFSGSSIEMSPATRWVKIRRNSSCV